MDTNGMRKHFIQLYHVYAKYERTGALLPGLKSISQKQCEWEYGTHIKEVHVQVTLRQHHKPGCTWYKHYHKQLTEI